MNTMPHVRRGAKRVEKIGELGRCARKRPSPGPQAARLSRGTTGEAVADLVAIGTGGDSAYVADMVTARGSSFVAIAVAVVSFAKNVEVVVGVML